MHARAWFASGMEWKGGPRKTGTQPAMTASGRRRLVCESPGSIRQNLLVRYSSICFSCVVCAARGAHSAHAGIQGF